MYHRNTWYSVLPFAMWFYLEFNYSTTIHVKFSSCTTKFSITCARVLVLAFGYNLATTTAWYLTIA